MNCVWRNIVVTSLIVSLVPTEAYRVLVVFPLAGKSHSILGYGLVRELLKKGHEVTYITPFPVRDPNANLTQIDVSTLLRGMEEAAKMMSISKLLDNKPMFDDELVIHFMAHGMMSTALAHENVVALIQDKSQHFDVVVAEWFYSEILAGFAAIYRCPLVWTSSMDVHSLVLRLVDDYPNPAYMADVFNARSQPFSFLERVAELWLLLKRIWVVEFTITSVAAAAYEERFGPAAAARGLTLPPYGDLIYNASVILSNGHPSLGDAPRLPQNVREVGGYHIDSTTLEPLPKDLKKLLDESTKGVIYFSLGSNARSEDLPSEFKDRLLQMFGSLEYTVLWKVGEKLQNLPKNVNISSWFPQPRILAHPNTRLFITHGGLLSTIESIHFGVPTIGIPLFGDQFTNTQRAAAKGFAVPVKLTNSLPEDLRAAIEVILGDPSYTRTAYQLSALYHDRPMPPAQEAVYWIEHAARTRGAAHLRSPALLLPWYKRFYVDLLALILVAWAVAIVAVRLAIRSVRPIGRYGSGSRPIKKKKFKLYFFIFLY